MLYPESNYKVYSGKLISIELELERIQNRLEMSSFIILMTAFLSAIYLIFNILEYGFKYENSTISIITIILYLGLWYKSYKFPLVCFIVAIIVYSANLILNSSTILGEPLTVIAYRLSVPIILVIGIANVFYSWYCVSKIQKRETENPECVKSLIYIVKEKFVYNEVRFYNRILNNIDSVELKNNVNEITLNDSTKYINYNIAHHAYNKDCQLFIEKPILSSQEIVELLFELELKTNIHIYISILFNLYNEADWIDELIIRSKKIMNSANQDLNTEFILGRVALNIEDDDRKNQLFILLNDIKNGI